MYTKIVAADLAVHGGASVAIANGGRPDILAGLCRQEALATWFPARITPSEGRKRWMLAQTATAGRITVDAGAGDALVNHGRSLLPVGVVGAQGEFARGAIVAVVGPSGHEIARGLCNYAAADLDRLKGQRSADIADLLGYDYGPEVIHRNKLVLV
jgi:glutamate 5-kinase